MQGLTIEICEDDGSEKIIIPKKTSNRMTRFEYTMLIAARALQLSAGAHPLIDYKKENIYDPREIAERELNERIIPLVIQRNLPDGSKEFWKVEDMYIKNY